VDQQQPQQPQQQFQVTNRAVKTALPVDATELSIRHMDWKRIYRKVRSIPRETSTYSIIAAALLGVSASAFLSLLPLYQSTQKIEPWVKPAYWSVAVSSLVIAAAMFYFARERGKHVHSTSEEVLQDMSEINKCYFPDEDLDDDTPA
jgi:hypothetical protein